MCIRSYLKRCKWIRTEKCERHLVNYFAHFLSDHNFITCQSSEYTFVPYRFYTSASKLIKFETKKNKKKFIFRWNFGEFDNNFFVVFRLKLKKSSKKKQIFERYVHQSNMDKNMFHSQDNMKIWSNLNKNI